MLTEQGFVQKATRRMSGDGAEMDEMVDSTVGSVRQASWMDNIIDGIFGLFGRNTAGNVKKSVCSPTFKCTANAVIAQRPVAPIKQKCPIHAQTMN